MRGERVLQQFSPKGYDRILVDAPCSSDRHLLKQRALATWSTRTCKENAERQIMLLTHAEKLLRPGGVMVYSTCALNSMENDEVVEKFLRKTVSKGNKLEVFPFEAKEAGWLRKGDDSTSPLKIARFSAGIPESIASKRIGPVLEMPVLYNALDKQ